MQPPKFWEGKTFLSTLLLPLSWVYRAITCMRCFFAAPYKSTIPVICIGNVTMGGAGKTPVAIAVARLLQHHKKRVVFLSKGYGGKIVEPTLVDIVKHKAVDVGDEPILLSRVAPTFIAENRKEGMKAAMRSQPDVIIMDDGFQNPTIHKHLNILVIDGNKPFGNHRVFPAGNLREPLDAALERSHIVVWVGSETHPDFFKVSGHQHCLLAHIEPSAEHLNKAKKYVAFAGIGNPQKFFDTLDGLGMNVVEAIPFDDHHPFSENDIVMLRDKVNKKGAQLITTEKDAVRLPSAIRDKVEVLPIVIAWDNKEVLETQLQKVFRK